jgi:signal transduction histidine kinase
MNENGSIVGIDSSLNLPHETCQKAANLAWNQKKNYSTLKVDNRELMYLLRSSENDSHLSTDDTLVYILFLDVTESSQSLSSLLTIFLVVGSFMLIIIAAISFYFANRSVKPIMEAWEKQEQFIADASHELKTPITIIKSNLSELKEVWKSHEGIESQVEWFEYIDIGIERMSKLVNELLQLLETENTDEATKNERFDLSKTIEGTIPPFKAGAVQKMVSFSVSIEPCVMASGNSERIAQVITILLDNAVKYTNNNGWIEVSLRKTKHQAVCSIKNSGKGISQKDLTKIFDRFYRADSSRSGNTGSFGLGLPIAKNIMDKLDGKISAECETDGTTIFTFSLKL